MKTQKTNTELKNLAVDLYRASDKTKSNLWKRIADDLLISRRQKKIVNVFTLALHTKDGEVIVIPGKLLGTGDINHKVTVAAFDFSKSAVEKIKQAKGNCMTITELVEKNPKGKDVRIFA